MPRQPMSDHDRAAKVLDACEGLTAAINAAMREDYGTPAAHAAWSAVEDRGATIHRQSRLLAGKSKGG